MLRNTPAPRNAGARVICRSREPGDAIAPDLIGVARQDKRRARPRCWAFDLRRRGEGKSPRDAPMPGLRAPMADPAEAKRPRGPGSTPTPRSGKAFHGSVRAPRAASRLRSALGEAAPARLSASSFRQGDCDHAASRRGKGVPGDAAMLHRNIAL